jgi:hypothetical protein
MIFITYSYYPARAARFAYALVAWRPAMDVVLFGQRAE